MLCLAIMLFISPKSTVAQLMRIEFVVEEEFFVGNLRYVQPGLLTPGDGQVNIALDDTKAGRVSISAAENLDILVSVEASEQLAMDAQNAIPWVIESYYINDGTDNSANAVAFTNNHATFPVNNSGLLADALGGRIHRLKAHIVFAGDLYIGDIEPGVYYGRITVRIEI